MTDVPGESDACPLYRAAGDAILWVSPGRAGPTPGTKEGQMNKTTAIRLVKPGYSPAKGMQIYDSRWYRVTLQDVEVDALTDYHGLKDSETTYIMPGEDARQCRDRALNHCNRIEEHTGPVWAISWREGGRIPSESYTYSEEKAQTIAQSIAMAKDQRVTACREAAGKYRKLAATASGKAKELYLEWAADSDAAACDAAGADWAITVQRIA